MTEATGAAGGLIIRILGEGQYDVAESALDRLNELDAAVEAAIEAGDEASFRPALHALLEGVRAAGVTHDLEDIHESDLILPHGDASMDEVRELLADDGLIPG
ncbi:PspA-associated protein PspAA [Nocardioides litoris]|uniref:PspA-associated protein PspAA n=1 Tax=Nocardioides litoris TaxID=1926648 RepID=UPI00111FA8BE|nr:hypothetical protein [Nocardioides litoris]